METESNPAAAEVKPPTIRCERCGATLGDADELVVHMEAHAVKQAEGVPEGGAGPSHKCALCDSLFETPEALKAHLLDAHAL